MEIKTKFSLDETVFLDHEELTVTDIKIHANITEYKGEVVAVRYVLSNDAEFSEHCVNVLSKEDYKLKLLSLAESLEE